MTWTIELPVCLAVLAAIPTAAAISNHLRMPVYRWFMRRQLQQVIEAVGTKARLGS